MMTDPHRPIIGPPMPGQDNVCCYTPGTVTNPGPMCRETPMFHLIGRTAADDPDAGWASFLLCIPHVELGRQAIPVVVESHWIGESCPRGSVSLDEFIMAGCLSLTAAYPPEGNPQ